MDSADFVKPYSHDTSWTPLNETQDVADIMAVPRARSLEYGMLLHDFLSGANGGQGTDAAGTMRFIATEATWIKDNIVPAGQALRAVDPRQSKFAFGELRFHVFNTALLFMWGGIVGEKDGNPDMRMHREMVRFMQISIAVQGMKAYANRRKLAPLPDKDIPYAQLDRDQALSRTLNPYYDGLMTEVDAAITGLEFIVDKPGLLWLPAPAQFERGSDDGSRQRNADFIVVNLDTGKAVGASVKTKSSSRARVDTDRVIMIDGDSDLANVVYVKQPGFSEPQRKSVPGLVSAAFLSRIQSKETAFFRSRIGERDFTVSRMMARQLLGKARPRVTESAQLVGHKLKPHLGIN